MDDDSAEVPGSLIHEDGTVCTHGRDIAVDYGDGRGPVWRHTTGGGVGFPCSAGLMVTRKAGVDL